MSISDEVADLEAKLDKLRQANRELEDELYEQVLDERDDYQAEVNELRAENIKLTKANNLLDFLVDLGLNRVDVRLALDGADKVNKIKYLLKELQ